jgi:hypothetical protein
MKFRIIFYFSVLFFSLVSCIDIFDDLTIHNDGTGTYKYSVNLSASKLKINSILALDSLDGKKIPSIIEIQDEINRVEKLFKEKEGIKNVSIETDFVNFLFKFQCDFDSLSALESAVKSILKSENWVKNIEDLTPTWFDQNENKFSRIIPDITIKRGRELNPTEIDLLSAGKYRSITRFDRKIEKFENETAMLNPDKTAIALQTNIYSLINNSKLLENTIYLSPIKQQK